MKTETIKIGVVGVDSGQLIICDPSYIESEFKNDDDKIFNSHRVLKHKDGKLWQFCYGGESSIQNVNPFTGTYSDIIPEYGMCPNDLIEKGLFEETDIDATLMLKLENFHIMEFAKLLRIILEVN